MKRIVTVSIGVIIVVAASVLWMSCGSGTGSDKNSSGGAVIGNVALYATDDMSMDYKKVDITVNSAALSHTGSGRTCEILSAPVDLDLTDLSSMIQLLDVKACSSESYNRIHVEFSENVDVTDRNDVKTLCRFTSYKDNDHGKKPNVLKCSNGVCSIDINGAVNVLAGQNNELALDFDLKEFEVEDFNTPDCSVTMKVSPLHGDGFHEKHHGYEEGMSGVVSGLDTGAKTFTLTSKSGTFTVSYNGVAVAGIDNILALAAEDGLKTVVRTSAIDLGAKTINASVIYVKAEGSVSALNAGTFTLTYPADNIITVDYSSAREVEGVLSNGARAEVKLSGHDGVNYLAWEVEVE